MTQKKGWGTTVAGWFVVKEGQDQDPAMDAGSSGSDSMTDQAPADTFDPSTLFKTEPPPPAPGGHIDYDAVFEAAGVDEDERQTVKKAVDLLGSLPAGTEPTVKKQIVEASLKAFGVSIEKIIEAGVEEIQALEGYIRAGASDTQKVTEDATQRIQQYEDEIRQLRQVMQQRVEDQQKVMKSCNEKKIEIQQILEFFGMERVAKVVKDSPKLHDPSEAGQAK